MRPLAATGLAAALLAGGALAQTTAPAGGSGSGVAPANTSNAPLDITAEETIVLQPQRLVIYRGNVEAIQEQTRLRSPELRIYYKERQARNGRPAKPAAAGDTGGQSGSLDRVEALGPFYYVTPTQTAKSDHAVWLADPDTITLTGHVVLTENKNVTTGDKLVINRRTGEHKLSMNNPGGPAGRVRAIIFPNQNNNQPGQGGARPAAPAAPARAPAAARP
jgi:lipopolysaccharide export system protein LptA